MGDHKKTLHEKPKLEELYQGIPDESVNLTFQDLANVNSSSQEKNTKISTIESNSDASIVSHSNSNTSKIPSSPSLSPLSLSPSHGIKKGFKYDHHHHQNGGDTPWGHYRGNDRFRHVGGGAQSPHSRASEYSTGYDPMSGESLASGKGGVVRRRRSGIPHSKICTICSNYIYIFRTRCLVCGRVYCKQCVEIGMGDMTEGRKCIECLGLRFSQRYIERAGMVGCWSLRYPSTMKQVELKWAEKGPRRSGDKGYGHQSRPTTPLSVATSNETSFVMSATNSPAHFSPHHRLPL